MTRALRKSKELLGVLEAAERSGVSVDTIRRRLKAGHYPGAVRLSDDPNSPWMIPAECVQGPRGGGTDQVDASREADHTGQDTGRRSATETDLVPTGDDLRRHLAVLEQVVESLLAIVDRQVDLSESLMREHRKEAMR